MESISELIERLHLRLRSGNHVPVRDVLVKAEDLHRLLCAISQFRHQREVPTEEGFYVLYNQCDGYHLAEAAFEAGEFICFQWFGGGCVEDDFYVAWVKLPDPHVLYWVFADRPTETKSAHQVAVERIAAQRGG